MKKEQSQKGSTTRKRKIIRGLAWVCGITTSLLCIVFYLEFWRCPLPSFLTLPPGSQVIVSRPGFVMMEGTSYYLRARCPGKPQAVLSGLVASIAKAMSRQVTDYPNSAKITKLNSSQVYKQTELEGFFPRVYAGPPEPTSEGYTFSYGDPVSHVSVDAWPDGDDTQIELTINHTLP